MHSIMSRSSSADPRSKSLGREYDTRKKVYVFGSSTPRELSYMKLPRHLRIASPRKGDEFQRSGRNYISANRKQMGTYRRNDPRSQGTPTSKLHSTRGSSAGSTKHRLPSGMTKSATHDDAFTLPPVEPEQMPKSDTFPAAASLALDIDEGHESIDSPATNDASRDTSNKTTGRSGVTDDDNRSNLDEGSLGKEHTMTAEMESAEQKQPESENPVDTLQSKDSDEYDQCKTYPKNDGRDNDRRTDNMSGGIEVSESHRGSSPEVAEDRRSEGSSEDDKGFRQREANVESSSSQQESDMEKADPTSLSLQLEGEYHGNPEADMKSPAGEGTGVTAGRAVDDDDEYDDDDDDGDDGVNTDRSENGVQTVGGSAEEIIPDPPVKVDNSETHQN